MNDKELRGWYIDCALAFQASEMGLSPILRSKICEALNIVFAIGFLLWMPLTIGLVLFIYNTFIN